MTKLIIDTNRIIAALIKDSASRKIILSDRFQFLTVEITKSEIAEHKKEILEKAEVRNEELEAILSRLFSRITVISDAAIKDKMGDAKKIMDAIDPDDTPFIALALAVENKGIWSNDKHFEQQDKIRIWKTIELLGLLGT